MEILWALLEQQITGNTLIIVIAICRIGIDPVPSTRLADDIDIGARNLACSRGYSNRCWRGSS